jgi:hypothetical protein
MPPKESRAPATRKPSEDTAIIDLRLSVVIARPTGSLLERFVDLAKKRPDMFFEFAKAELYDNPHLVYLEGDDDARIPIDRHLWSTLSSLKPDLLVAIIRALGDALMAA